MRLRKGDFEETQHAGGVSPAWPITLDRPRALLRRGRNLWFVHGARGDDPTENGDEPPYAYAADPPRSRRRGAEDALGDAWAGGPSPCRSASSLDQANPLTSNCIKCKTCGGYPCLLKAKCRRPHHRHRADARPAQRHPADRPQGAAPRNRRRRAARSPAWSAPTEQGEERWTRRYRRARRRRGEQRRHPAGLGQRRPSRRPGQFIRPGRAQLHVPQSDGDDLADARATSRCTFPKTLAVNDFYWGDPDGGFDLPMGHIQMLEYMSGQTLEGEVSDWLPPAICARRARQRRRIANLEHDGDLGGSAGAGQPRPPDARRAHPARLHPQQSRRPRAAGAASSTKSLDGFVDQRAPDLAAPLPARFR